MKIICNIRGAVSVCVATILGAFALLHPLHAAPITGFDDIDYWVGSGSNQAAMVIDWNDGISPVSLAWGFRWDGIATGWDMITAIASADPRLSLVAHPLYDAAFGIYYDVTGSNAGFTSGNPDDLGGPEDGSANNAGDHYKEGWFSGYWAYNVFGGSFEYDIYEETPPYGYLGQGTYDVAGSSDYPASWFAAPIGASQRELVDGAWDAWSFNGSSIDTPIAAVPEPGTFALLAAGALFIFLRRVQRQDA